MARTVAVLGGGVFGACAALELSKSFDVTLVEREAGLLRGATHANHNRHHFGYHYPRSLETAAQCLRSREPFERRYGPCLDRDFDNYYAVAKEATKTDAARYAAFCREAGLPLEEAAPPEGVVDRSLLAACFKAPEAVYDIAKLRAAIEAELAASDVKVELGREATGARFADSGRKRLAIAGAEREFDVVVNATYANVNRFASWLGFPARRVQFNLQELAVIELPLARRVGITIQDGPFPSFIPIAGRNQYLFAHVVESQLVREVSDGGEPLLSRVPSVASNYARTAAVSLPFLPILERARHVRSIFVDRVVDAARLEDDSRVTELTDHGRGCWSIFSAKVITCVTAAAELRRRVEASA